jgi:hypothetical protein
MNLIVTNSNETPIEFTKFEGKELKRQTFSFDKSH